MSELEFRSLQFARNMENDANVYKCDVESDVIKITVGTLPPLQINSKFDDFVDVHVSHVSSSARFHVQLKDSDVVELGRKMNMLYSNPSAAKPLLNPQRGQLCAIKNEKDQLWYRAVVVSRFSPKQVEVFVFDFGYREKILLAGVKELHAECSSLPAQAIECKLQNVDDKNDADTIKKFREVSQHQPMVIRLIHKEESALVVTLYKVMGDTDFNVNELLMGKGSAPALKTVSVGAPLVQQENVGAAMSVVKTAVDEVQASGNSGLRGGSGARGGGNENRGSGFNERPSGFGDRSQGGFGVGSDRGAFRGGDRGGRGRFGNNRGGFGDRSDRSFGGDNASDRGGGFGGSRTDSFGGDGSQGGRRGGIGRTGGYNRDPPRGRVANSNGQEESASKESGPSPGSFIASKTELVRPGLKVNDVFTGTIIQANSPFRFWITTARESGFNRLPDAMWDYAKSPKGGFTPLANPTSGASCLLLKEATGDHYPLYCRAIITNLSADICDLWLVDYAEAKKAQPVSGLFEVPVAFAVLPWQAVKCQLCEVDEFRTQFGDEKKNKAFVDGVSQQEVTATVKGFDGVVAIVDVRIGIDKRNLCDICKSIAAGDLNAFGIREGS